MSTIITIDFETYSEAGYIFAENRWKPTSASPPYGLGAVGAAVYAEHPSTEILSLAYSHNGGVSLWTPDDPPPVALFEHIKAGGLVEAWNSAFEFYVWHFVACRKLGWPSLPWQQLRDPSARARAVGLPSGLSAVGEVLHSGQKKDSTGTRLINKFSKPRQPTKHDTRTRTQLQDDPQDAQLLYDYCAQDVRAEQAIASTLPELSPFELNVWLLDQLINYRGVHVDKTGLNALIEVVEESAKKYKQRLHEITNGAVSGVAELAKFKAWLETQGVNLPSLTKETVATALTTDLPPLAKEALQIRSSLSSSSVQKLYAFKNRLASDSRLHGLFSYCGATHTGRFAGRGVQPQNLPNSGLSVNACGGCDHTYRISADTCPWCGASEAFSDKTDWDLSSTEGCLTIAETYGLDGVESFYGDAFKSVSGCLRGLLCASPEHDLICSDYSSIEAVILAELAGEQWRQEIFRTDGEDIYKNSASKLFKIPVSSITPTQRKVGKVAELASGYQGSVGAWKKFKAEKYFKTDEEILSAVRQWRADSPSIVLFWRSIEDIAKASIACVGQAYSYKNIAFQATDKALYCLLPSGRKLTYNSPSLVQDYEGRTQIQYYATGVQGSWLPQLTYGGKLTENIVQAVARDVLCYAMLSLEQAGYPIVMHIHDEIVAEVPVGVGSIENFEYIMSTMPPWASSYPIKAKGGWRGKRYRK